MRTLALGLYLFAVMDVSSTITSQYGVGVGFTFVLSALYVYVDIARAPQ